MGEHRLLCADATDADAVKRVCGEGQADLVFTSPPYLQQRQYNKGIGDWDYLMHGIVGSLPCHDETQVLINLGLVHREGQWVAYWDAWLRWMEESGWRRFGWYVWDSRSADCQGIGAAGLICHQAMNLFSILNKKPCKYEGQKNKGL